MKRISILLIAVVIGLVLINRGGSKDHKGSVGQVQPVAAPLFLSSTSKVTAGPTREKDSWSQLVRSVQLAHKAIRSKQELVSLQADWSSSELLTLAQTELLDLGPSALTTEAQDRRMRSVDFLGSALLWKENPRRQAVVEIFLRLLERDVNRLKAPLELRRSLAGDAIELYAYLLLGDRERAQDLVGRSSREQQRLFQYARSTYSQNTFAQNQEVQK